VTKTIEPDDGEARMFDANAGEKSGTDRAVIRGLSPTARNSVVSCVFVTALGLLSLIVGIFEIHDFAGPFVAGLVILAASLVVWPQTIGLLRPIVMTRTELKIPEALRTTIIPLATIAGVGLSYQWSPGAFKDLQGWFLEVWDTKGARKVIRRFVVLRWRAPNPQPGGKPRLFVSSRGPLPVSLPIPFEDDPVGLAETRPARVATQVSTWIMAQQGPNGPLASLGLQKKSRYEATAARQTLGWWSPDGTMGRTR